MRGAAAGNKGCGDVIFPVWRELLHGTVTRNSGCRGVMLSVGSGLLCGAVTGNKSCGDVMLSVWCELLRGTVTRNSGCRGVMLSVGSGLLRGTVIKKYSCDVFFTAGSGV